jgi:hypothetical protein
MAWKPRAAPPAGVDPSGSGSPGLLDYIPVLGQAYHSIYGGPAEDVKAAYAKAMGESEQRSGRIRDFLMGQQGQALGYYKPVQNMFERAYGVGLKPQQTPGQGGR